MHDLPPKSSLKPQILLGRDFFEGEIHVDTA
jgi:hypothetical protein